MIEPGEPLFYGALMQAGQTEAAEGALGLAARSALSLALVDAPGFVSRSLDILRDKFRRREVTAVSLLRRLGQSNEFAALATASAPRLGKRAGRGRFFVRPSSAIFRTGGAHERLFLLGDVGGDVESEDFGLESGVCVTLRHRGDLRGLLLIQSEAPTAQELVRSTLPLISQLVLYAQRHLSSAAPDETQYDVLWGDRLSMVQGAPLDGAQLADAFSFVSEAICGMKPTLRVARPSRSELFVSHGNLAYLLALASKECAAVDFRVNFKASARSLLVEMSSEQGALHDGGAKFERWLASTLDRRAKALGYSLCGLTQTTLAFHLNADSA